jgi:hypothetical protein
LRIAASIWASNDRRWRKTRPGPRCPIGKVGIREPTTNRRGAGLVPEPYFQCVRRQVRTQSAARAICHTPRLCVHWRDARFAV